MSNSERMAAAGIELPQVAAPVGTYVPALVSGQLVFTSGQVPKVGDDLGPRGLVGREVDLATAQRQARTAALNAVAAAAAVVGGVDNLARAVKLVVFVAATPEFDQHPAVANGASEVLGEIFGSGHARSAVGAVSLPMNVPVEVELIAEVAGDSAS